MNKKRKYGTKFIYQIGQEMWKWCVRIISSWTERFGTYYFETELSHNFKLHKEPNSHVYLTVYY